MLQFFSHVFFILKKKKKKEELASREWEGSVVPHSQSYPILRGSRGKIHAQKVQIPLHWRVGSHLLRLWSPFLHRVGRFSMRLEISRMISSLQNPRNRRRSVHRSLILTMISR